MITEFFRFILTNGFWVFLGSTIVLSIIISGLVAIMKYFTILIRGWPRNAKINLNDFELFENTFEKQN